MPRAVPPVVEPGTLAAQEQPVISGADGLVLSRFEPADAPALLEAFADEAIRRWHIRRIDDVEGALAWITASHAAWRAEASATWAARSPADEVLGRITLYPRLSDGWGEISYWVLPSARRQRVAARALAALTRWAHHDLGLHRLEVEHSVENPASCRVAQAAGYVAEGTRRASTLHADGWHDMHLHAHLATDEPV